MGQIVEVLERPSSRPGIVRFETNRVLSGTGHDRFLADQPVVGNRPVDELARRLFSRGGIVSVHINSGVVTVDLAKGHTADGLADIIRGLYTFYEDVAVPMPPATDEASDEAAAEEARAQVEEDHAESAVEPTIIEEPAGET
jgi:hypothetical protein